MTLRLLHAGRDRDRWLDVWKRTLAQDPFAHPDYCELFTAPGVTPLCAVGEDDRGEPQAVFPFLLRELSALPWTPAGETRRDIAVAAGYGGAYGCEGAGPCDPEAFWRDVEEWARTQDVVCADARVSLYRDEILPLSGWQEQQSCDNIVVDLDEVRAHGHAGFRPSLRKKLRQAARAGVTAGPDDSAAAFDVFQDLYVRTMGRRGAIDYYYFTPHFFEGLRAQLAGGFARLFVGRGPDGAPHCAEVVLLGRHRVYDFLAGSDEVARGLHAHALLRATVCDWLAGHGEWGELVLGGGNAPDDELFRYKQRFAPLGRRPYHVASRIYDPGGYAELVRLRGAYQESRGLGPHVARRFPAYR
ncbi:GNAT family N-acetyltransferase [Streptomyces sp. NPDC012693]|uniref:GNAT family N-acetyltransferase n=1 Tax=Streptomyces sp. NPDC012693 TaxID=3364844 RepID=UPI0036A3E24E